MINYYFDNTNALKPYTHQLEANDDTVAPDNALRIAPEFKKGFYPCENNGAQTVFKTKQNKSLKNSLLNEANENISILQDAIDFDMAEDGDEEKLKLWKKYRILLNRIDASDINVIFPEKP